jgi:hypothetical protein
MVRFSPPVEVLFDAREVFSNLAFPNLFSLIVSGHNQRRIFAPNRIILS